MGNLSVKEFRIGNLYTDIDNQLSEMSGYEIYQMSVKENNDNLGINEYKPIPLTEDWLMKFGFEKTNSMGLKGDSFDLSKPEDYEDEVYHQGQFWYDNETINIEFDNENGEYASINFRKIRHVHQLQNLYFALTGGELEIN